VSRKTEVETCAGPAAVDQQAGGGLLQREEEERSNETGNDMRISRYLYPFLSLPFNRSDLFGYGLLFSKTGCTLSI
jgi:hypothetical protein